MKNTNLKFTIFLFFILLNCKSYGQELTIPDEIFIEETIVEEATDSYSELSPKESLAHMEITKIIIKHCYDYTATHFEGKYQSILSELKNFIFDESKYSYNYSPSYDKLLFIVNANCTDNVIKEAREKYEYTINGAPAQIKYWVKFNEDKSIDFEYRYTLISDEPFIEEVVDLYSELSPKESLAHMEVTKIIIKHCYDYTYTNFEGKYQAILSKLKNSNDYYSEYDKLLFIVDFDCPEDIIKEARRGYEVTRIGAPNQIRYWVKFNEDTSIEFEYRHTLN